MALEGEFFLADSQIAVVHNLGDDVNAIAQVKVDEIRLAIFHLVDGWFLLGIALDVGKFFVMVDGGNRKGGACGLFAVAVVERKLSVISLL